MTFSGLPRDAAAPCLYFARRPAAAVAMAADAPLPRPPRRWPVVAGLSAAHAAGVVVKRVVRRVRPALEDVPALVGTPSRLSFPSAHSCSTSAAAVGFGPMVGRAPMVGVTAVMLVGVLAAALQAPVARLSISRALEFVPSLQRAAADMASTFDLADS